MVNKNNMNKNNKIPQKSTETYLDILSMLSVYMLVGSFVYCFGYKLSTDLSPALDYIHDFGLLFGNLFLIAILWAMRLFNSLGPYDSVAILLIVLGVLLAVIAEFENGDQKSKILSLSTLLIGLGAGFLSGFSLGQKEMKE